VIVSINREDLEAVIRLACLSESRNNQEQKALLTVAQKTDRAFTKQTQENVTDGTNHPKAFWRDWGGELVTTRPFPDLEKLAHETRVMDQGDRAVKPSWERKR
jgi:hypothetical protein